MSEEKHHHHGLFHHRINEEKHHHHGLFHHRKEEEEEPVTLVYTENVCGVDSNTGLGYETTDTVGYVGERPHHDYEKETKEQKHKELLGEIGAVAAGAFALYEKHEAKKDPDHKHRHKIEEEIVGAVAVALGAGGYTFHEHHEKKEIREEEERAEGKKHHHHF